ncbi:restriction endonuclease subunit M [Serratia marcescens]|nr:restriction endonuclease subunit M [Serratia marcescens]
MVRTDRHGFSAETQSPLIGSIDNAALAQIEALISKLDEISTLTGGIGGGKANEWGVRQYRYDCWLMEKPETAMKAITRNVDRSIWKDLMNKSGMLALMDAQARDEWYNNLEKDDIPAISEENILSTFKQLHLNKGEVFERGVINVFKGLSWNFKTNSPCRFGGKIIVTGLVKYDRWGFGLNWDWQRDRLADLERMLILLDGKPVPDNRADVTRRLSDHIHENRHSNRYEDEVFTIKYFQKGTAHITFKRPELVDKLNDIIAKHYPGMLAGL